MFKTDFSGQNKIGGAKEIFEGHCPQMPLRGYGPVARERNYMEGQHSFSQLLLRFFPNLA